MMLYQYRGSIDNSKGFGYLVDLLKCGSMKFEKPSNFNDPFDCCPTNFSEVVDDEFPHLVGSEINSFSQTAISTTTGIACFTLHANSMLMWSHYGDQHRSVCVGFDFNVLKDNPPKNDTGGTLYAGIDKVEYTEIRPDEDNPGCLTQKAKVWSYEDEYRIISNVGPGVWNVPVSSIKEIVIGARVTPQLQKKIVEMAKKTAPSVVIKRAVLHMRTFDLVIKNLEDLPIVAPMVGAVLDPNGRWRSTIEKAK